MPLTIPSGRAEFHGFEKFFETSIAPYLAEKEGTRAAAVTNVLIVGAATAALVLAILCVGPFGDLNFQLAALTAASGAALGVLLLNKARADIKHGLLDRIARKLGFAYRGALERPGYYDTFRTLKLLPSHNREEWEDEVSGAFAAARFTFCEAHLKQKSSGKNDKTRTVFHGQLFLIDYPKRFLGTTILLRDMGPVNALMKPGKEFQRVGLSSPAFEKAFEAWSTDQVEARDLLDPIVLERFQELERLFGGKKLRAAFADGKLLIVVETGDRLNIGTMFAPLKGPTRVEAILREFDAVFDLIDVALTLVEKQMTGAFTLSDAKAPPRSVKA